MTQKHEPALPNAEAHLPSGDYNWPTIGLTAIEHAALVTGQPCSGTPWLDDMIRAQRRERLAGQALAGLYVGYADHKLSIKECSNLALDAANDLITELEGGAK